MVPVPLAGARPIPQRTPYGRNLVRVGLFESTDQMPGKLLVRLNITARPIVNKYREGKLKRTLKRELRGRETG